MAAFTPTNSSTVPSTGLAPETTEKVAPSTIDSEKNDATTPPETDGEADEDLKDQHVLPGVALVKAVNRVLTTRQLILAYAL